MNKFMEKAIRLGEIAMNKNAGGPFGAVIVCKNKIVGQGYNKVIGTNDPTKHAEMVAISNASAKLKRFDLSDCVLYASGQPCPMCLAAIAWARIKKVYYANDYESTREIEFDDHDIYQFIKGSPSKINIKLIQIDKDRGANLYRKWKNKKCLINRLIELQHLTIV